MIIFFLSRCNEMLDESRSAMTVLSLLAHSVCSAAPRWHRPTWVCFSSTVSFVSRDAGPQTPQHPVSVLLSVLIGKVGLLESCIDNGKVMSFISIMTDTIHKGNVNNKWKWKRLVRVARPKSLQWLLIEQIRSANPIQSAITRIAFSRCLFAFFSGRLFSVFCLYAK